jgi:hypothetical protein
MSGLVSFSTTLVSFSLVVNFMEVVGDCLSISVRVEAVQVPSHSRISFAVLRLVMFLMKCWGFWDFTCSFSTLRIRSLFFGACIFSNSNKWDMFTFQQVFQVESRSCRISDILLREPVALRIGRPVLHGDIRIPPYQGLPGRCPIGLILRLVRCTLFDHLF